MPNVNKNTNYKEIFRAILLYLYLLTPTLYADGCECLFLFEKKDININHTERKLTASNCRPGYECHTIQNTWLIYFITPSHLFENRIFSSKCCEIIHTKWVRTETSQEPSWLELELAFSLHIFCFVNLSLQVATWILVNSE